MAEGEAPGENDPSNESLIHRLKDYFKSPAGQEQLSEVTGRLEATKGMPQAESGSPVPQDPTAGK